MKSERNEFWLKRTFRSSWFFALILFLLIIFSIALFREMIRKLEIQNEIKKLETDVTKMQNRNNELTSLIEYFKSDEFVEKEGRTKLGLKMPGETVVSLASRSQTSTLEIEQTSQISVINNYQVWKDYFFSPSR
ncbi:MAG: septum formation initiator family protein [Candidatus Margulisiibacteriota bacterium]|jgi:cell division protein FtsB